MRADEIAQDIGFERSAVRLAEQPRGLVGVEPQVVGAELGDLAGSPQAGNRD